MFRAGRGGSARSSRRTATSCSNFETYQAAIDGKPLDLTYMEYELLKFFVTHPGKVFTREQLLSRVWGYEYYGGARTVDVHVRRLRAKLGEEHANLIQTVRSVGYRFGQVRWPGAQPRRRVLSVDADRARGRRRRTSSQPVISRPDRAARANSRDRPDHEHAPAGSARRRPRRRGYDAQRHRPR